MAAEGDAGGSGRGVAALHVVRRPKQARSDQARADRAPTVLMLHGISDAGACWETVAAALDPSYDVLMPDLRGHGTTPLPDGPVTAEVLADDVAAALGTDEPVVVIGHSMGAATAVALAARHPSLVHALVLEDPPWVGSPADVEPSGSGDSPSDELPSGESRLGESRSGVSRSGESRSGVSRSGERPSGEPSGPGVAPGSGEPSGPGVAPGESSSGEPPAAFDFAGWLRELQRLDHAGRVAEGRKDGPDWSDAEVQRWAVAKDQVDLRFFDRLDHPSVVTSDRYLEQLDVPTLLVTGDPDLGALVTPERAERARASARHLEVLHLEDAGHSIHRDRCDAYLAGVQAFLDRVLG